jgi:hypothetical protein
MSADVQSPHRLMPACRGFVHPRLSYASGARNSSGKQAIPTRSLAAGRSGKTDHNVARCFGSAQLSRTLWPEARLHENGHRAFLCGGRSLQFPIGARRCLDVSGQARAVPAGRGLWWSVGWDQLNESSAMRCG